MEVKEKIAAAPRDVYEESRSGISEKRSRLARVRKGLLILGGLIKG